jgi:hypothetical protein
MLTRAERWMIAIPAILMLVIGVGLLVAKVVLTGTA